METAAAAKNAAAAFRSGKLKAQSAANVIAKQKHPQTKAETLLLINIGTHEDVY
jgi:hypothetical protein